MTAQIASHRYYIGLLISLLSVFILSPFFGEQSLSNHLSGIALILTLLFCLLVITPNKIPAIIGGLLALPLVINGIAQPLGIGALIPPLAVSLCGATFILLVIAVMLKDMFMTTRVDAALIIGAVSLYLLLGLMWGFIYAAIEEFYPGSFHYSAALANGNGDDLLKLFYYSIVTLTTLGYGDVTPLSAPARAMATMQAVAGQIYLTVLVARLVGMHIAQKK